MASSPHLAITSPDLALPAPRLPSSHIHRSPIRLRSQCSFNTPICGLHSQHRRPYSQLGNSLQFISGTTDLRLFSQLQCPPHPWRSMPESNSSSVALVRAAFIFEWIGQIFRFITKTPVKLFAEKLEADLNKAAKMIKTGASIVKEVAEDVDKFAEGVEMSAEQAEAIAEKVEQTTEVLEQQINDVLDVLEGEKKLVVTSYKLIENTEIITSTTASNTDGNKTTLTVEKIVNDSSPGENMTS